MNKFLVKTIVVLSAILSSCNTIKEKEVYKDTSMSFEKRVNDLIRRMTLEQKISLMMFQSPAIDSLGIQEYNWWNEGLHGVAGGGFATVFPQAIGLGATWDYTNMKKVAECISTEFRCKYNDWQLKKDFGMYKGLTIWSPNINIFRDPRWGRGQETYGEDPMLTAAMGVAFVKGLQGDDPKYLKCVSTPKHYAVHSGPEPLRHNFNAQADAYDFADTYSPAFEACIIDGKAQSIMGAYNQYNGIPACASPFLLQETLRDEWGFNGCVVSDCGAIEDIYRTQKFVKTGAEAAAYAVKAGTDLECGDTYSYLKEAVDQKLITEAEIDIAVKRVLTTRFKLGMFDPVEMVPFSQLTLNEVDTKENRALALETARKSIVLLKNENKLLPLSKSIKSIAIIGPNANNVDALYGNYCGVSSNPITPLNAIDNKLGKTIKINNLYGCNYADLSPMLQPIPGNVFFNNGKPGLSVEYFNNENFEGDPLKTSSTPNIEYSSKMGIFREFFKEDSLIYIRWIGEIKPKESNHYLFSIEGSYEIKLYIDDKLIATKGKENQSAASAINLYLEAGKNYTFRLEFKDISRKFDWPSLYTKWAVVNDLSLKQVAAKAAESDVILMFGGISPRLEGEEMKIKVDGFLGGDRTKIELPVIQTELLKELKATGKPVVLVLLNGSAMALPWVSDNIPAIVEAWYPGEEGGNAIMDVLFGDYNPGGRLPVTFYKSTSDLPDFNDYCMDNRTYRYFSGDVLYPFGYGLSYTSFTYCNLRIDKQVETGKVLKLSVDVKNTGNSDGEEVVQLYIKFDNQNIKTPIHALKLFKRVFLKAGEKTTIEFALMPKHFTIILPNGKRVQKEGEVIIYVGGQQPNQKVNVGSNVLESKLKIVGNDIEW